MHQFAPPSVLLTPLLIPSDGPLHQALHTLFPNPFICFQVQCQEHLQFSESQIRSILSESPNILIQNFVSVGHSESLLRNIRFILNTPYLLLQLEPATSKAMTGFRFLTRAVVALAALAGTVNGYPVTTFSARHSKRQGSGLTDIDILQL